MAKVLTQNNKVLRQANKVLIQRLIGNGLEFDGVNDYVELPADPTLNIQPQDAASFETIFFLPTGTSYPDIVPFSTHHTGASTGLSLSTAFISLPILFFDGPGGRSADVRAEVNIRTEAPLYAHVVLTKDASHLNTNWKGYFNGEDKTQLALNSLLPGDTVAFKAPRIGTTRIGSADSFTNQTQHLLRIYDKQLTASEVKDLYNQKTPKELGLEGNLLLDLDFNHRQGTTVIDRSGNGNHGTLNGFSTGLTDYGGGAWRNSEGGVAK